MKEKLEELSKEMWRIYNEVHMEKEVQTQRKRNWEALADGQSGDAELEKKVLCTMARAFGIWQDRQRKYGRTNIARTGATGCYVRLEDKVSRLHNVYIKGGKDTPDESIVDTWLDAINYAIMGVMSHENDWPSVEGPGFFGETGEIRNKNYMIAQQGKLLRRTDENR